MRNEAVGETRKVRSFKNERRAEFWKRIFGEPLAGDRDAWVISRLEWFSRYVLRDFASGDLDGK